MQKKHIRINNKRILENNALTLFKSYEVIDEEEKNYYSIINENGKKVEVLKKYCKDTVPAHIKIIKYQKRLFGYYVELLFNNRILITSKKREVYDIVKNLSDHEIIYCDEIILKMNMDQKEILNYLKKVYENM